MRSSRSEAAELPRGAPEATAASLVVTGVLMVLAIFLMSNRWFGVSERLWPWEMLARSGADPLIRTVFLLWVATALGAIVLGLTRAQRVRSVGLATLTAVLLVECTGQAGGFVIDLYNLNQVLPMMGLGAGLLIARHPATRGLGRLLAGICSVALVWVLASTFVGDGAQTQLQSYWLEMKLVLTDWNHEFEGPSHFWWTLMPRTLVILAAVCGLMAFLGFTQRHFLIGAFITLALGIVLPFFVGVVLHAQQGAGMKEHMQQLARTFISYGFLVWLLGVFVIFDLARGRMRAA